MAPNKEIRKNRMMEIELSASQARELTDRIKLAVEATWELIKEAYQSMAWRSLGYASWDDYCTREFGTSRIKLPREERQEVVSSMREIGMSTRAIASATGNSRRTIQADIRQEAQTAPPESDPAPVVGTDGKTYTPKPRPAMPKPEYTPEQLASKRQREANERAARYIENFAIAYATVYQVLQNDNLDDILQLVTPDIRNWFTVAEKEMTWPAPR